MVFGSDDETTLAERAKELLFYVPEEVDRTAIALRAVLLVGLVIYGVRLAAMDIPSWEIGSALIHLPMVPIHEFGHVLFMPFGGKIYSTHGSV